MENQVVHLLKNVDVSKITEADIKALRRLLYYSLKQGKPTKLERDKQIASIINWKNALETKIGIPFLVDLSKLPKRKSYRYLICRSFNVYKSLTQNRQPLILSVSIIGDQASIEIIDYSLETPPRLTTNRRWLVSQFEKREKKQD